jgi:glycogen debranching enzyme
MVHFTPLQALGASNSAYCIFDQLQLSSALFGNVTEEEKSTALAAATKMMELRYGILSMTDVVWNHTASNSVWLQDHPEAGYNVTNSPHLRPALELDDALLQLSVSIASGLRPHGLSDNIGSEGELRQLMDVVRNHVVNGLRLWEFYVVDVDKTLTQYRSVLAACSADNKIVGASAGMLGELGGIEWHLGTRFGSTVDLSTASSIFGADCGAFRAALDELNQRRYRLWDDDRESIMRCIEGTIRYTRLDPHGERWGSKISQSKPLLRSYFTRVNTASGAIVAVANNGFV